MNAIFGTLLPVAVSLQIFGFAEAHPAVLLIQDPGTRSGKAVPNMRPTPSKRAFDRLDMSPFDFGSLSKRYFDEDDLDLASRGKRAFDRITGGGFGLGLQKRAFDRIDGGFMLGKRSSDDSSRAKRAFDRIDSSGFGLMKRSDAIRLSDLARENDLSPYLYSVY
ncbi:prepro-orcokinin I [Aphelenchoides avenae]|nr:prepro-orcokinin I [Aphelenchus avenae]